MTPQSKRGASQIASPTRRGAESAPYLFQDDVGRAASPFAAAVASTANPQMRPRITATATNRTPQTHQPGSRGPVQFGELEQQLFEFLEIFSLEHLRFRLSQIGDALLQLVPLRA